MQCHQQYPLQLVKPVIRYVPHRQCAKLIQAALGVDEHVGRELCMTLPFEAKDPEIVKEMGSASGRSGNAKAFTKTGKQCHVRLCRRTIDKYGQVRYLDWRLHHNKRARMDFGGQRQAQRVIQ
jgi:hypothetical protein